ncbi:4-hydroxy-3-methylbut-2-en-1-yl diphosphate synthase [Firmicutes bacterium CAG:449]|nr:4-hydroxy-3-methylbut-2-en-1-yl diphosphate synthase [Firmicutes bacterium CAG:449]
MGCIVNGPGEGKHADIGLAGGNKSFVIFKKGKIYKTIKEENALEELIKEINNF